MFNDCEAFGDWSGAEEHVGTSSDFSGLEVIRVGEANGKCNCRLLCISLTSCVMLAANFSVDSFSTTPENGEKLLRLSFAGGGEGEMVIGTHLLRFGLL